MDAFTIIIDNKLDEAAKRTYSYSETLEDGSPNPLTLSQHVAAITNNRIYAEIRTNVQHFEEQKVRDTVDSIIAPGDVSHEIAVKEG